MGIVAARYETLTLHERWQHGGDWMSVETGAVHLNWLLAGSGTPLVVEVDGEVMAEAELYEGFEAAPFDHHLHVALLYTHHDQTGQGFGGALIDYTAQMAKLMGCLRVTVANPDAPDFYTGVGFRQMASGQRVRIPTQAGRAFYQASELTDRSPEQIYGWRMPLGRYQSARQEWDALFPQDWAAGLPELLNVPMAHLKMTVAGQNALVFLREADLPDSQPGECSLACWSLRPLTPQLLAALRDRAYREGFQTISTFVMDSDLPLLAGDDTLHATPELIYELPINSAART